MELQSASEAALYRRFIVYDEDTDDPWRRGVREALDRRGRALR
jgi:hypothetical protein